MSSIDYVIHCTAKGCPRPGYHLGAFQGDDPEYPIEVDYSCGHRMAYAQEVFDEMVARAIAECSGPTRNQVLDAIGSTENTSFYEFCSALVDCPRAGEDTELWAALFKTIETAARDGLVVICRENDSDPKKKKRIKWLWLTPAGADMVRGRKDEKRGLLELMK